MTKKWGAHRKTIVDLYIKQKLTLVRVMEIMREEHGFHASMRAFRNRLDQWGLKKYRRRNEAGAQRSGSAVPAEGDPASPDGDGVSGSASPGLSQVPGYDFPSVAENAPLPPPEPPRAPVCGLPFVAENALTLGNGPEYFDPSAYAATPNHPAPPLLGACFHMASAPYLPLYSVAADVAQPCLAATAGPYTMPPDSMFMYGWDATAATAADGYSDKNPLSPAARPVPAANTYWIQGGYSAPFGC